MTYIYDNRLDANGYCGVGNLPKAPGLPLPAFPLSILGYSVVGAYCMFGYTAVHEVRIRLIVFFPNATLLLSSYIMTQQCAKQTVHLSVGPQHGRHNELCYLSNLTWKTCRVYNYDVCSLLLQGCSHDRGTTSNAESNECGTGALLEDSICNGSASTAYGWRSPAGTFHTVMAYPCQPGQCDNYQGTGDCFEIPYFSGDYDYKNGETLGGEQNNCRKEIMKNKRKIAAYR